MSKTETFRRYLLFIISLFFSGIGVAFTKHGALGVSPISSVANVMSIKVPSVTLGTWLIIWNCLLILGQILILRKKFQPIQLLQIPVSFLFGWFTDLGMSMVNRIPVKNYLSGLLLVFIGIVILGFGIGLSVIANVIMNSGEAFVKAIADTIDKNFGNVKVVFDVSCMLLSIILSLAFFHMKVIGTREGTILSAVCTGFVVKFFTGLLKEPLDNRLSA